MIDVRLFGKKFVSRCSNILMTNNLGGFFHFSPTLFSKYQGFFFGEDLNMFKTLDSIKTASTEGITKITYDTNEIEIVYPSFSEILFMPNGKNAIVYKNNSPQPVLLSFDCRQADDMRIWGRYYDIYSENGVIIVKYRKVNDASEPVQGEYEIYTAIVSDKPDFEIVARWEDAAYPFDESRNDYYIRALYKALTMTAGKIAIASSKNKEQAIKCAKEVFENTDKLKQVASKKSFASEKVKTNDEKISNAYNLSLNALKSFEVINGRNIGVYAGLPWFYQFWTRDSALSARALLSANEGPFVKKMLFDLVSKAGKDGLIPSREPPSALNSIDGTGLVLFRMKNILNDLDAKEIAKLQESVKEIIVNMLTFHSADDMIISRPYESWMDTDIRSGALIEVQCLQLAAYSLLKELSALSKDVKAADFAAQQEAVLKDKVRKMFFVDNMLLDNLSSSVTRPNIFLAYYVYPDLLSKEEWERVFDNSLKKLFLQWGGLATIETANPRFTEMHTGINNKSYHNGDSWFFINNLAALCLHRVNKEKYKNFIKSIVEASTEDILNKGIFGFHSEQSSALHQEATGCLAQLWSSAFYVEMIKEIYP